MKRYISRWALLDLTVMLLPWLLMSTETWARAGGGSGGSCHGWICIALYPVILLYGAYVSMRITLKYSSVRRALAKMKIKEPQWSENNLLSVARERFILLQTAWGTQDLDVMRTYLHPSLYPNWEMQVKDQQSRNERNVMSGLSINKIRIVDVQNYKDDERDEFTVAIDARANDQTFTNEKVTKSENSKFREFWTFEWENGSWALREVTQAEGWKRFVNAHIINE